MTEAKFTPGPWKITRPFSDTIFIKAGLPGLNEKTVVLVQTKETKSEEYPDGARLYRDVKIDDAEANAALIAAAPELYGALDDLVNSPNAKQNALWDKARAALAKAQGKR